MKGAGEYASGASATTGTSSLTGRTKQNPKYNWKPTDEEKSTAPNGVPACYMRTTPAEVDHKNKNPYAHLLDTIGPTKTEDENQNFY